MTTTPSGPPPGRNRRIPAPRDWSLRVKLAVVLLVPGVLAAVLGGLRIADQSGQAAEADRVSRFATAQGDVANLLDRLQRERVAAAAFIAGGRGQDPGPVQAAVAATDQTVATTTASVETLYGDDATLVGTNRHAQQAIATLPGLRTLVLTSNAPASATTTRYSDLIDDVVQLDDTLLRGISGASVNKLANGLAGLAAARDETSLQQALVTAARTDKDAASALVGPLQSSDARLASALESFRSALDVGQRVRYAALIAGQHNTAREAIVQQLLAGPKANSDSYAAALNGAEPAYQAFLGDLSLTEAGVRQALAEGTAAQRSAAVSEVAVNAVLLLIALLIGAAIVGLLAREMLRSLRTLRTSALEVARRRLPEAVQRMRAGGAPETEIVPVPVRSQEEIGEVARAFDAVHRQAVRLAAEQAMLQQTVNSMFVNLSRRSQTLVDRQLQLIEELEKGEQDADQLGNLFRLDHLATRMRRNSENLLVLAGTDLSKRAAHRVPFVDVLRAAVSETEQYERITLEQAPPVAVAGRAANDLQHLIAELLDNATSFSSPGSPVVLSTTSSSGGALIVEIVDHGVGMPPQELTAANALLGQHTDSSVTASRRMGLFVVARLASRHGVVVRLVSGPPPLEGGAPGLTARVTVPRNVVVTGPGPARPQDGDPRRALPSSPSVSPPSMSLPPSPAAARTTERRSVWDSMSSASRTEGRPAAGRDGADSWPLGAPPDGGTGRPAPARPDLPVGRVDAPASQAPHPAPHANGATSRADGPPAADVPAPRAADGMDVDDTPATGVDRVTGPESVPGAPDAPGGPAPDGNRPDALPRRRPLRERRGETSSAIRDEAPAFHGDAPDARSDIPAASGDASATRGDVLPVRGDVPAGGDVPALRSDEPAARSDVPSPRGDGDERGGSTVPAPRTEPRPVPAAAEAPPPERGAGDPLAGPIRETADAGRTPIFEEVSSGWFRTYRQVPINWAPDPRTGEKPPAIAPRATPAFASPADEGWAVASTLAEAPPAVTDRGLPRRTPGARLIPGTSESGGSLASSATAEAPSRDASAVRDRLRGYQRGVRQGREGADGTGGAESSDGANGHGTASDPAS